MGYTIFNSGNLNSFSYKQVLKFYREDLDIYPSKFFQQDGEGPIFQNYQKI